ncbi:MAG: AgmX/PglI C-terminal domain-containing protein [Bdellovibrionales bacterium]|nr:AgmX/PglI C-terminal domain-containing protein [Oligoflexia bacterium]
MSAQLVKPKYLVKFRNRSPIRWDGHSPLKLGHPVRYLIEKRGEKLVVRNFVQERNLVHGLKAIHLDDLLGASPVVLDELHARDTLSIKELTQITAVAWKSLPERAHVPLPIRGIQAIEDILFKKHLQKVAGAMAALFLVVMVGKLRETDIKTNEELIPQKYAKLILTKPKENPKAPAAGGATQSQAQVKAVARAFQSKTVQKSISSILKGGLTKYSVMATGRAINSLSQKIQGTENVMGVGLQNKATDILAGAQVGKYQVGSENGYGSGNGVNVNGQGKGQFEIGLNTADASVDEGLTKEEVARVIHSHMREIRYCYEAAIAKDANQAGKLMVDFKINGSGIVPNAGVSEATTLNAQVSSCLVGKLKTWKFPNPRGGVMVAVSYPFIFKSLSR